MKNLTPLLFCMLLLAACGGDDDDDLNASENDSAAGTEPFENASPPPSDMSILTRFFVESFDSFEAVARSLIEKDERYLLQKKTWFIDKNGNDKFDSATETRHTTYPLQSSGVHYAHAAGLTGAGQIIAVTDEGFLAEHEAFEDKSIDLTGNLAVGDHGTLVASVGFGTGFYATTDVTAEFSNNAQSYGGSVTMGYRW